MMKKLQVLPLLCISIYGLGQIPNLPTISRPNTSSLQNYSNQNYGSPARSSVPSVPHGGLYNQGSSQIKQQNMRMVQEDFKKVAQEQELRSKQEQENRLQAKEDSYHTLPSFSGKAGTESYYHAFNILSGLDTNNYSISEANFIVENAYYGDKQNYNQFKSGIQKTAKQLLQKMKERKQDTESNTDKNLMIFEYLSKGMKLGGVQHKAIKYDFEDYMGTKDWSKMFVSKLLKTGSGQCHSMPLYYLMLAEEMNAEAHLAFAPNHTYIKFKDEEGEWQNAELTNGIFTTSSIILESGYIKSEALQNDIYMSSLSKKELMGQLYADLANGYAHKYGMDEFVGKTLDKALEYSPNNIYANLLKSTYQQAKLGYVAIQLGIKDLENPEELQSIRFYPKALALLQETKAQFNTIDNLGYVAMPEGAYEEWLGNMKGEANKQKSEAIAERMRQINAEKQKQKQLEALRKAQEQKKKESDQSKQKAQYFPIDPKHL
ncbi:cell envelope integrity protein TolA [Chryseobacterium sp. MYb328]|uniref:cell envelope integrity protein TolA n=1 Tax=Chryseobacterium sp. MYb328 TaxID=2745231 RepID=UPI0030A99633